MVKGRSRERERGREGLGFYRHSKKTSVSYMEILSNNMAALTRKKKTKNASTV